MECSLRSFGWGKRSQGTVHKGRFCPGPAPPEFFKAKYLQDSHLAPRDIQDSAVAPGITLCRKGNLADIV